MSKEAIEATEHDIQARQLPNAGWPECFERIGGDGVLHLCNAIHVFEELKRKGHQPVGIRLDSGDLAHLSIQAAMMLDAAGFPDARIVLSNQLDELVIMQIIAQIQDEAAHNRFDADAVINRLVYGAGTNLITSAGDPRQIQFGAKERVTSLPQRIQPIRSRQPSRHCHPGQAGTGC